MEQDEHLGSNATMAAVLFANINHPEWKLEFQSENIFSQYRTSQTKSNFDELIVLGLGM